MRRLILPALILSLALVLTACGDDGAIERHELRYRRHEWRHELGHRRRGWIGRHG